jgi:hypothetical protein
VVEFAVPTDVETAYEGSLPSGSVPRIEYLLTVVSARLRAMLPDLEARIEAANLLVENPAIESDLAILARDAVVNAVIRRVPGSQQQTQSETQTSGPWSVTKRYTTDSTKTFPDDDLALLAGETTAGVTVGTIKLGWPDWSMQ